MHAKKRGILGLGLAAALLSQWLFADTVSINFRDADIRSVIESVAEVTGKSFVLDPRVKGKISIIAPEPIEQEFFYEVFLSSLQVQGFQAVEDGAVVRIVPFTSAFDVPGGTAGNLIETRVLEVNHVKASELLPALRPLLSKGAQIQANESSNHIIITDTSAQVRRVRSILRDLDTPDQSEMEVIPMEHISTGEALHIISQMKVIDQQKISIVEDELNNRIIISGQRVERNRFRKLLKTLDVPTQSQSGVEVVYLNHADAEEMQPLLTSMLQSSTFQYISSGTDNNAGQYKIEADTSNNALIIAAPSVVSEKLKSIIRQLDRPRDQVLIEAVVAEVSEDKARELSVQLAAVGKNGGYLTNFSSIIPILGGLASGDDKVANTAAALNSQTGLIAGGGDIDEEDNRGIAGLVRALQSDGDTNILSTPSVVTLDNEEAELSVGQEVPFVTGSYQTQNNQNFQNPFQTINREEVGIKLKVRPQVNEDSAVKMAIEQESSNVLSRAETASLGAADVVTATRKIATNVVVGDGELLILGGLIGEDYSKNESRVPVLGSIPILGNLFKSRSRKANQRVLMIFIRPTVIKSSEQARDLSTERYRYIRNRQLDWPEAEKTEQPPSTYNELDQQIQQEREQ